MMRAIRTRLRDFIAMAVLAAIGLGTALYILQQERLRIPVVDEKAYII